MSDPNVEKVRKALEWLNEAAAIVLPLEPDHDALIVVFDAARRIANLDMDEASRVLLNMTGLAFRAEPIVFAALGITKDTK